MLPPIAKPAVGSIEPIKFRNYNKYMVNTPLGSVSLSTNDKKIVLNSRNDNMSLKDELSNQMSAASLN